MSNRKVYFVSPDKDEWVLKEVKAKRAVGRFGSKPEAVRRGKEIASKQTLGQLIIKNRDGTIEEERTYGKDPHPPEG